jgi:hypothetical protein
MRLIRYRTPQPGHLGLSKWQWSSGGRFSVRVHDHNGADSGSDHAARRGGYFLQARLRVGVAVAGLEIGYLVNSPALDLVGDMVGRDFVNTWLGAQLALTGDPAPYFGLDA